MATGCASSGGAGGCISPAASTSSISGINLANVLLLRKISLHAKRTSRSGSPGLRRAISKAFGTTVSNLMMSAIS